MSLKIGNTELPGSVILAPMAGVSDLPFRLLCHEQGADLVCMEMVSAKAIAYHNRGRPCLAAALRVGAGFDGGDCERNRGTSF